MKPFAVILFAHLLFFLNVSAQEFNKSINKDSLVKVIVKGLSTEKKKEFLDAYSSGSEESNEFLLLMLSMPKSSKSELIKNIDQNYKNVDALKVGYAKLVPANYIVSIEFEPANNVISTKESIDLEITAYHNKETTVTQDWNMAYNSDKLNKMLMMLNWNYQTLKIIKQMLTDANCISIMNGEEATIGYARSGMEKYSYILFNHDLNSIQIKNYNTGCNYIYYKKNIVLVHEGGAVGPDCFPDPN